MPVWVALRMSMLMSGTFFAGGFVSQQASFSHLWDPYVRGGGLFPNDISHKVFIQVMIVMLVECFCLYAAVGGCAVRANPGGLNCVAAGLVTASWWWGRRSNAGVCFCWIAEGVSKCENLQYVGKLFAGCLRRYYDRWNHSVAAIYASNLNPVLYTLRIS